MEKKRNSKILPIIAVIVVIATVILIACNLENVPDLAFSEVGRAKNMAREDIKRYLNEKYGFEHVNFRKIYVDKDYTFMQIGTHYTNWIYATVKTDDNKKITVASYNPKYFDEEGHQWGEPKQFDDYQYEQVKADIERYIDEIVGEQSYCKTIEYKYPGAWLSATGTANKKGVNIDDVLGEKYTGNIKKYITDNNLNIWLTAYYINVNNVEIPEEEKEFIDKEGLTIALFNFSSQKALLEKLNVNKEVDTRYYSPYIRDMYFSDIEDEKKQYYKTYFKETNEKIKYAKLFSDEELLDEQTFRVEPGVNLDNQIERWIPQYEYSNGRIIKENKVKRVTDYYNINLDYFIFFPVSLIQGYASNKKYVACAYYPEETSHVYSKHPDVIVLNEEYINVTTSSKKAIWFIVEVEEIYL